MEVDLPLTLIPSPQPASGGNKHFDQTFGFHLCLLHDAPKRGHGLRSINDGHGVPLFGVGHVNTFRYRLCVLIITVAEAKFMLYDSENRYSWSESW